MSNSSPTRREFFKQIFFYTSTGVMLQVFAKQPAAAQSKPEMIDMSGKKRKDATNTNCVQTARNLNYRDKATDLAKEIKSGKLKFTASPFKDKSGKDITLENRTCAKCALYSLSGPGNCALIPGCLVAAEASCTSWSMKAGI